MSDRDDETPTPAPGATRPDDVVLDELSKVFGSATDDDDLLDDDLSDDGWATDDWSDDAESGPGATVTQLGTVVIGGDDLPEAVYLDDVNGEASTADDSSSGMATISIGGDDDLPDAVYLDDHLDDTDGSGGTVFIDDDGIGDALAPKDATASGIEPRIRQRRIGVNRAANRRRLKWLAIGVLVVALALGALTLLGSGLFAIDQVTVQGNVYTDQGRLDAVIEELEGTPVLLADTESAEQALEAIPWVDDARVRARFPGNATIEIRERTPVATMRGVDGLFRVLDPEGRVLDVIEGQPVALILIAGPGTLDQDVGTFAPIGQASAASLVTKLTPTIRPRVESIQVTDDGADLVMILSPDPVVVADPFVPPPEPVDVPEGPIDPLGPEATTTTTTTTTTIPPQSDGVQTSSIIVRFGSAIGDSEHIEKLVRLEKKLAELPDRNITEINVSTNEVTEL